MARSTAVKNKRQPSADPSLLEALSRLDQQSLAALLEARPDLGQPPPSSLGELAERAGGAASVQACREALDCGCHQVLEALCLLSEPATMAGLARLLAVDEGDADLAAAVGRLCQRALVWRDGDRLRLLPGAEVPHPAGLGPPVTVAYASQSSHALGAMLQRLGQRPGGTKAASLAALSAALSDPANLRRLLSKAPPGTAELVELLADRGPFGHHPAATYAGDRMPAGWLVGRGMVASVDWSTVVLVREVGLAARGGRTFDRVMLRAPELAFEGVDAAAAERAAAEQSLRLVADLTTILDGWAADPPRQLKAGGLGIQAVRRAAKAVERSETETARIIELAAAAGLASLHAASDAALPLPAYDDWCMLPVAGRWSQLVSAWLAWDLHLGLAGALDSKRKPIPPLLVRAPEPDAAARRSRVLAILASAPAAQAVAHDSLVARALWEAPQMWSGGPASPSMLARWTLAECDLLGLCGLGTLSPWGRLAAAGEMEAASAALAGQLPTPTDRFVVQADLTAVAPAELERPVMAELAGMADVESRGAATVLRFSEQSIRRSFEAGRSAAEILGFLERHAARGVPQALAYLVNDLARRFGQLRVTAASCCLRSDDPALLAEVVASRAAKGLGLRLLAPTVAVAAAAPPEVLSKLRAAGYLPAQEALDGSLVLSRPEPRRAVPHPQLAAMAHRHPGRSAGFGPAGKAPAGPVPTCGGEPLRELAARLLGRAGATPAPEPQESLPVLPQPSPAPQPLLVGAPRPALSLFDGDGPPARSDTIVRSQAAIEALLEEAWVEDWPLRLAYTNRKGRTTQINVAVLDLDERDVVVEVLPSWQTRVLALSRIQWARMLTEAEEEAL